MNDDTNGLDFEVGPEIHDIPRQSFRFPIKKIGSIKVLIDDQSFDLVNLVAQNKTGIGVRLTDNTIFSTAQRLQRIQFSLDDIEFNLQGNVQHISPDGLGQYLCGIELTEVSSSDKDALLQYIEKLRKNIFQVTDK